MIRSSRGNRVLRSWSWTLALSAAVCAVLLVGLVAFSARDTWFELLFALATIAVGLLSLYRVLTSGVYVLPSGLIIRELTRSTPVPWARIRSITTAPTARRGVHAPVLVVTPAPGASKSSQYRIEVTILASYHESVAKRRAAELAAARSAASGSAPGRS